jgi:hypothetical protein
MYLLNLMAFNRHKRLLLLFVSTALAFYLESCSYRVELLAYRDYPALVGRSAYITIPTISGVALGK